MIHLYGALAKKFPKKNNIIVNSVSEAICALEANFKGFRNAFKKDRKYIVVRGDTLKTGKSITEEEIDMNFSERDWHILPVPAGYGGNNGVFSMILGAVMIVAGVVVTGLSYGWAAPVGQAMIGMGVGMMLGGVAQMLAPSPPTYDYGDREKPDERPSYLFDGPKNQIEPGLTIPLIYGQSFIGSIFISGGLEIEKV